MVGKRLLVFGSFSLSGLGHKTCLVWLGAGLGAWDGSKRVKSSVQGYATY